MLSVGFQMKLCDKVTRRWSHGYSAGYTVLYAERMQMFRQADSYDFILLWTNDDFLALRQIIAIACQTAVVYTVATKHFASTDFDEKGI